MSAWDSVDLLAQFNVRARRPALAGSDTITDVSKYDRLAKAQDYVTSEIAAIAPNALYVKTPYGGFPAMLTTDNQIFRFGSDTLGNPLTPLSVSIYTSLDDIPGRPWREGQDYIGEVTQIRIPYNRTYGGSLYWRGIVPPPPLAGNVPPVLFPIASRVLIAIEAVRQFAREGNRNADLAAIMQDEWDREWPKWALVWKTQFKSGGAVTMLTGLQLAEITQA